MSGVNDAVKHDLKAELEYQAQRQLTLLSGGAITPETTLVYRFFDTGNGTHFFTGDLGEATASLTNRPDLTYEESSFRAFTKAAGAAGADPNATPVYRFFETGTGTHFYTASESERAQVQASRPDMTFEGATFYEHSSAQGGDLPVFRFFDTATGTHLYTASSAERDTLQATRPDLKNEGVAFYAPTS